MAIAQQASRFALLQIEDDIDSDEDLATKNKQQSSKGIKQAPANKKKNKKKAKKDQSKQENAQVTLAQHIIAQPQCTSSAVPVSDSPKLPRLI